MTQTLTPSRARGLVRRALASDLVDRLTAPHGVDRYLELVDPRWVVRETRAEVTSAVRQTDGTVTLGLRPNDTWAGFRPGQHVVVGVEIDGVVHERCFSLAGSPHRTDGLELTVKAHPAGRVSKHLVANARAGLVVRLSAAQGDFTLPEPAHRGDHLVLVSGGSGITPVLSMLRALADEGHTGPVTFLHYADTLADVCYLDELRALTDALPGGRLLLGLTREPEAGDVAGFFGPEHLAAITDDPATCQVFLCGPAPLMASVEGHFASLGLDGHVRMERFGPSPILPPPRRAVAAELTATPDDEDAGVVSFERSGRRARSAGTLLETAEASGLAPRYGCRRGICGTCTTTKTSGVVRNVVTGDRSAADAEPVRLCVSVACGEVAVAL